MLASDWVRLIDGDRISVALILLSMKCSAYGKSGVIVFAYEAEGERKSCSFCIEHGPVAYLALVKTSATSLCSIVLHLRYSNVVVF